MLPDSHWQPPPAGLPQPLQSCHCLLHPVIIGTLVELTLINPGQDQVTGKVVVEVTVDGKRTIAQVPFTVWGGQKVFVEWAAPAPVQQIGRVGIIVDDGAPI